MIRTEIGLPMMALHLHQKDADLDPLAARLAEILLQGDGDVA
ncbi:hypothetical protein [Mesorhizobium sp. B4-1-1]|nr:hypothetical protein [Mesorhizobium sp. B4-1-1]